MGFFNRKERKVSEVVRNYFELLPGYIPAFTSYHGSLYEMDLCRAAVNSFAENCSKLKIVNGTYVNEFNNRERSSNIFEKIATGVNSVIFDEINGFEITLFLERSEPKWI